MKDFIFKRNKGYCCCFKGNCGMWELPHIIERSHIDWSSKGHLLLQYWVAFLKMLLPSRLLKELSLQSHS